MMTLFLDHLADIILETAPWLLIGLLAAGLIKAWVPEGLLMRWLGGKGLASILRAALVGVPLPLCSCSVIPVALALRRNGASTPATVSFLVATPETGVDSIALSWTLLGPFMTVARPVAAIFSAIISGVISLCVERCAEWFTQRHPPLQAQSPRPPPPAPAAHCCPCFKEQEQHAEEGVYQRQPNLWQRTRAGLWYALESLWNDIAPWLAAGLVLTALAKTWLPAGALQDYSHAGWFSMLMMVLVSMPIYVCATASTPMAAAMLYSGLSPGMTLAFLIAGPATNLAPLGIIKRELGGHVLTAYLLGILVSAMGLGMLTDWVAHFWQLEDVPMLVSNPEPLIAPWLATMAALLLAALSLRTLLLSWNGWQAFHRYATTALGTGIHS